MKTVNKMAFCWNPGEEAAEMREFNRENKDYMLVFSSRLGEPFSAFTRGLAYSDISNAAVVIQLDDAGWGAINIPGVGNRLKQPGKFTGLIDFDAALGDRWQAITEQKSEYANLRVHEGELNVLGNERQGRLIVYENE